MNLQEHNELNNKIDDIIEQSWKKISPYWGLENLIAVNPLQGFQDIPIEQALKEGAVFFEEKEVPQSLEIINIQTIKWLQVFFDEGQATVQLPLLKKELYKNWKKLASFDTNIHHGDLIKKEWLANLPESPEKAIQECFLKLNVLEDQQTIFTTLLLTTLPGWASYIKYLSDWKENESTNSYNRLKIEYIAIRIIITTILWENATELILWHETIRKQNETKSDRIKTIEINEQNYLSSLLKKLKTEQPKKSNDYDAQLIFCIDVRSEPFRKALENTGHYETFGYAGFFGIPVIIENITSQKSYSSCPVLLKPSYTIHESNKYSHDLSCRKQLQVNIVQKMYQSLKYNVTTAFGLIELIGFASGLYMIIKTFTPMLVIKSDTLSFQEKSYHPIFTDSLEKISFIDQCMYAKSALKTIGLTENFSPLVVFCGHASKTKNNAYATALDCGACGGHPGGSNARIIAEILNSEKVRKNLAQDGIIIPDSTYFIGAEHNTTTDEVEIYSDHNNSLIQEKIKILKNDLKKSRLINSIQRSEKMGFELNENNSARFTKSNSMDWAQVLPEWGLAGNASFIVGPRDMTKNVMLEGRSFLHSYDYYQDPDGSSLTAILTAPMIVAQWINSQYLFSTINNISYGSGSKITTNITGKFGIMQGNASDLMNGLPLQSVYRTETQPYHTPIRLMTIVYAPTDFIDNIINKEAVLQNLFRNGWVKLIAIDPNNIHSNYILQRDLTWSLENDHK